jgi:hypothetical protein
MKKLKLLSLGLALGAGLCLLPGCSSPTGGTLVAGFGTNSIGYCYKTATATNKFKLVLPFNPGSLVNLGLAADGL